MAEGQQVSKVDVANQVLLGLGISKPTAAERSKMIAWFNQEGGNWNNSARYNPLNTTLSKPGAGNTGSQGNIKVYTSWAQGIEATVDTLKAPAYKGIVSALQSGSGAAFEAAVNASPWGTKFPGGGNAVGHTSGDSGESVVGGLLPGVESAAGNAAKAAGEALSFNWSELGQIVLTPILLLVGAVLVVYGIIVTAKGANLPSAVPVPVPV